MTTITFHVGNRNDYKRAHNARLYKKDQIPENIDQSKTAANITLVDEPLKDAYHRLFDEAIAEYNKTQKPYRQIKDYLKKLQQDKQNPNYVHEAIVQIGTKDNTPDENCRAVEALRQYVEDFKRRNPQLVVIGAYIHLDEATPHLHLDWVPCADNLGQKARGQKKVASMQKALANQGYEKGKNIKETLIARWTADERRQFEKIAREHGFLDIEHPQAGKNVQHKSVLEYKIDQMNAELNDARQQFVASKRQLDTQQRELADTRQQLVASKRQLDTQQREFAAQKAHYEQELADIQEKIAALAATPAEPIHGKKAFIQGKSIVSDDDIAAQAAREGAKDTQITALNDSLDKLQADYNDTKDFADDSFAVLQVLTQHIVEQRKLTPEEVSQAVQMAYDIPECRVWLQEQYNKRIRDEEIARALAPDKYHPNEWQRHTDYER